MAIEAVQTYTNSVSQAQGVSTAVKVQNEEKKSEVKSSTVAHGTDTYTHTEGTESAGIYSMNSDGTVSYSEPTSGVMQMQQTTDSSSDDTLEELEEQKEELEEQIAATDDEEEKAELQKELLQVENEIAMAKAQEIED